ncbi:hypothetical protein Q8G43_06105 [Acinetobacter schindleri]|uniref:hypothetical protein n=1 Tax=Acinetobacter schindleri TaxID=108981 RepID=UPI0027314EC3|nr:hypothetical protein [Acinetobacter schindleri]MDP1444526.1 hypothetical protein [Acinetobacter schindleri]MDP1444536.1 hypothetical protein [Acinetobacter schindleri]
MAYVCKELQVIEGVQTCVLWAEQIAINDMFGITTAQAAQIGLASALVIVVAAVFNKLGQIGDKSHD